MRSLTAVVFEFIKRYFCFVFIVNRILLLKAFNLTIRLNVAYWKTYYCFLFEIYSSKLCVLCYHHIYAMAFYKHASKCAGVSSALDLLSLCLYTTLFLSIQF